METIFKLSGLLVLPFWGLMIFLPRWRWTVRIMRSPFVIAGAAALYAALALPRLAQIWPAVARPTLAGVAALLGSPAGAAIAWVHFLAFDLFVGRWIYLDSQERRISPWLMAPVLYLTLMLGPAGFLAYLALRAATRPAAVEKFHGYLHESAAVSRPLIILAIAMLVTFAAAIAGVLLDPRIVTGAPVWLKPAKFAISVSIYCFTFVWLLGFVKGHSKAVRLAANATVSGFLAEMAIIVGQAARGTTSHFNLTSPLNAALWTAMGAFIIVVWTMNLLLAVLLMRQKMANRAFAWSLRLGAAISLAGMAVAFLMTAPTPQQMAGLAAGHGLPLAGAHSVGVPDGGPGLPILGWSTVGGDLRIAHFVGLHGLQILPLIGWLITRKRGIMARLDEAHRVALVWTAGMAYLGLVLLLTWQALRGEPLVHPSGETLAAATILFSLAAISALVAVLRSQNAGSRAVREVAACTHAFSTSLHT